MPFIAGPLGAIRVVVDQSLDGQQCLNVLHYKQAAAPTFAELQALAQAIYTAWTTNATGIAESQGPEVTINSVTATSVQAAGGLQAIVAGSEIGKAGTAAITNSLAFVISLRTAQAGRSFRGRLYLCGLAEGNLADPNHLIGTSVTNTVAFATDNLIDVPAALATPAVLSVASYYSGMTGPPPGGVPIPRATAIYTAVTHLQANTRLDQQRRRMPVS